MNTAHSALAMESGATALATYLQQMRDEERADLARELHDELGSLLTGAKLEVASLRLRLDGASAEVVRQLAHLSATINSGIAFSRRVVEGLHPSSLTNLGLVASLEILAREFGQSTGIATATDLEAVDLDSVSQLAAYRVAQESLNNTSKYAAATQARIVMLNCGGDAVITVSDNGGGFETASIGTSSHGLAGMHHRVAACGGQLTVSSTRGRGTLLVAVLPGRSGLGAPAAARAQPASALPKLAATALQMLPAAAQRARRTPASPRSHAVCRWWAHGSRARHGAR
jgi:signal transduction histidine kinase